MTIPTTEPTIITAGDLVEWTKSLADYPAGTYTLSYVLVSAGQTPITITATADGTTHAVSVPTATTAAWVAGIYRWTSMVTKTGDRKTISSGSLEILPDPSTLDASFDPRTHAELVLAQVEAAILAKTENPMAEYELLGRRVKNYTFRELLDLRIYYRAEVRRNRGGSGIRMIPVRLSHV
jgi:hypothetical protein